MERKPLQQPSRIPLALVAHGYVLESSLNISPMVLAEMDELISSCIAGDLHPGTAAERSNLLIGTSRPIEKLTAILTVKDQPLCASPKVRFQNPSIRKKSEVWSEYEDQRLLAGIHKFGIGAWGSIARFVGHNRTKAQCCQRWCRGLDPRISKSMWTSAEDYRLQALVHQFGRKAWTRIATEMGNRSDVQCRYRFNHLQTHSPAEHASPESPSDDTQLAAEPESPKRMRTPLPPIMSLIADGNLGHSEPTPSGLELPLTLKHALM
jgi:hypothetical protein